jgi:hypothetical protein
VALAHAIFQGGRFDPANAGGHNSNYVSIEIKHGS